ncbi:MAG: hypothetical protein A2977_03790 [Alphaproteobacteria bacterium RIFCSPLOWO2_01_FULL_45_8]|nr:MAG: hypothetical protein A2065_00950 [Alphaproteobacteria bacterium GWB1_45_5]OFW76152.1 MAG: hypothetical protein A3K20_02900 [Alphaproteobacteria bacterium GWA1_45_9]OFW89558.1 MAG: hypothetical protein A2621_01400 [Alphaproteobacteria bacterium RIFCSPHIGHO2_01_FULL_41_14]OFW96432.1 MAG: hypothetical protein A2977_03790 [Alphaproteobacteria bacterium RIFCSPLOWO2_01_FULL_45_8]HCI48479.1 hypothetical protein [Holosporales bacterium]
MGAFLSISNQISGSVLKDRRAHDGKEKIEITKKPSYNRIGKGTGSLSSGFLRDSLKWPMT